MSSDTEPHASELLSGLFSARVLAFETHGAVDLASLHPLEARHVSRSAPKRVRDFAAGRACVRAALAQLSIRGFAVRSGTDREPLWPPGITGSITHTGDFCGAVLARASDVLALGIDAESRDAVHPRLWRQIATEQERHWLETLPAEEAMVMATVLFSAKESFFN